MNSKEFRKDGHHPWLESLDWKNLDSLQLFNRVDKDKSSLKRPAWVFDLDSTLFCVEPRTRQILSSFLRKHPNPKQHWWQLFSHMGYWSHTYGVQDMFELAYSRFDSENAKKYAAELWIAFEHDWMTEFFKGRTMYWDQPYPGAVDFVNRVHQSGVDIIYLTGREYEKAFGDTYQVLKNFGFPVGLDTKLILKPWQWKHLSDLEYKSKASIVISSQYDVLCSIDNEPENLIAFARYFPKATIVLFHSVMSKRHSADSLSEIMGSRSLVKLARF